MLFLAHFPGHANILFNCRVRGRHRPVAVSQVIPWKQRAGKPAGFPHMRERKPAGNLPETCRNLPETCRKPAGNLPETCRRLPETRVKTAVYTEVVNMTKRTEIRWSMGHRLIRCWECIRAALSGAGWTHFIDS